MSAPPVALDGERGSVLAQLMAAVRSQFRGEAPSSALLTAMPRISR